MHILAPDSTELFPTHLHPNLVRTGTIGNGDCFFHSVCYSLYEEYRQMDIQTRIEAVKHMRQVLSENTTMTIFKRLGNGEMFRLKIVEALRLPDEILAEIANKWKGVDMREVYGIIEGNKGENLYRYLVEIEKQVFEEFQSYILTQQADNFFIELCSLFFECNFYFIDSGSSGVYKVFNCPNKYLDNVIMLWVDGCHYEAIGEMNEGHNAIKYFFKNADSLIRKMN